MENGFYNGYDDRLLGEGTDTKYEEDPRTEKEPESEDYYELPLALKSRSMIWSVISLVAGILSILLCPFYYVGFCFAACAVGTSLLSRHNLGFFDKLSVFGLILGIMGFVCDIFSLIANMIGLW